MPRYWIATCLATFALGAAVGLLAAGYRVAGKDPATKPSSVSDSFVDVANRKGAEWSKEELLETAQKVKAGGLVVDWVGSKVLRANWALPPVVYEITTTVALSDPPSKAKPLVVIRFLRDGVVVHETEQVHTKVITRESGVTLYFFQAPHRQRRPNHHDERGR